MSSVNQLGDDGPRGGRLDLDTTVNYPRFERVVQVKKEIAYNHEPQALMGHMHASPLSKLFFSYENLQALQLGMKNMVYVKSCANKYLIGKQSEDELLTVMRSIFLQNAKHLPYDVIGQVRELNGLVLTYVVPRILSELDMYQTYLKDVANAPGLGNFDRGEATSVKGNASKQLEFKTFF